MTTQAVPSEGPALLNRRFAVRFMGRKGTWLWFAGTGALAGAAWALVALPARGTPGAERTWYLWSGNVLLALFVLTMLFVARKWSIKLEFFRRFGRTGAGAGDASWASIQDLNAKIRKGAYGSDAEIQAAADDILVRYATQKVQRAELRTIEAGGRTVKFVQLKKKEPFGRLEAWLEMHMGVGTTACLGVLLHADLALRHPIGWALLVLSMVVLVTGVVGAVLYRVIPARLAKADAGIPYEEAGVARESHHACIEGVIATLDEKLRLEFAPLLVPAKAPRELEERATAILGRVATTQPEHAELARDLLVMAGARDHLLWNTAEARRYDFLLRLWRWVHVPVSVALFFVIGLHVWAVLWY